MVDVRYPQVEWIWWMDSDALFTDMVFELLLASIRIIIWLFMVIQICCVMRSHGLLSIQVVFHFFV